jgi:hypothetical protein
MHEKEPRKKISRLNYELDNSMKEKRKKKIQLTLEA